MTWTVYKIVFRMESPLHSGWMKVGNVQRTRLYVTGRMLWGALTSRITRMIGGNYLETGNDVKKYLFTSYFYPCIDNNGENLILPSYGSNEIKYTLGNKKNLVDEGIVERALITSYASTSINPTNFSAEDGSLHEIELLSHKTIFPIQQSSGRNIERDQNVYLVGYIFESSEIPSKIKDNWLKSLNKLQFGGERAYGLGCVSLETVFHENSNVFGYKLLKDLDEPKLELKEENPVFSHTVADDNIRGTLEPFLGRETDKTGKSGENHSEIDVCWVPGSILTENKTIKISKLGLWELV